MRVVFVSLDFGLILLALVALLHTQGANAFNKPHSIPEPCREGNCLSAAKCELQTRGQTCPNSNDVCCSIVRSEYRTLCHQWGGECMDDCSEVVTRQSTDCLGGTKCCVLV